MSAFVYIEILISMLLIGVTMGSVVATYVRSSKILRASLHVTAASQMLQQRIEMIRHLPWASVAVSGKFAEFMKTATDSEAEMTGVQFTEEMAVILPVPSPGGLAESDQWFSVKRTENQVSLVQAGDFRLAHTLLLEGTVKWQDQAGDHQRTVRTVISRHGLTRSGIIGSAFGRADLRTPMGP